MYKQINIEMGLRIRSKRKLIGFTSENLAELVGISNQFLCDVELGKKSLSYTNLKKLCDLLCVSTDYIIMGKEDTDELKNILEILRSISPEYLPIIESSLANIIKVIATVKSEKSKY